MYLFDLVRSSWGNMSLFELTGGGGGGNLVPRAFPYYFPENFRSNLSLTKVGNGFLIPALSITSAADPKI